MNMRKLLKDLRGPSAIGLMFQAGTFVPLTGGLSANNQNLAGPLSNFLTTNGSLAGFLNAAFTMTLSLGAILAVLQLARAGWLYMGAADMWGSKQKAKEIISDAIIGLLLLIGIYIILYQINPNLLNLNVLQEFSSSSSQSAGGGNSVTPIVGSGGSSGGAGASTGY